MFLLLLLHAPSVEVFFLFGDFVQVGLELRLLFGDELVEVGLDLAIVLQLAGFELFDGLLANAFEAIEGLVPADGVLNDVLDLNTGGVEGDHDGATLYLGRHLLDVLAGEHVMDLHDAVAIGGRLDFRGGVDVFEAGDLCEGFGELDDRGRGYGGGDLGNRLSGVGGGRLVGRRAVGCALNRNKILVPFLRHSTCYCGTPSESFGEIDGGEPVDWSPVANLILNRRAFVAAAAASGLAVQGARPNIVMILTDDLGLADLGCYGAQDLRTPNIDRLAAEGVRFTQCYANGPLCSPTRAALMTGRYQQRVGIEYAWTPRDAGKGLPPERSVLASSLRRAGYRTALVGKWHLGGDEAFSPMAHGFDEFFGLLGSDHDYYSHRRLDGQPDLWEGARPVEMEGYSTDLFADRAARFVEQQKSGPFFLYAAFNAPHWPFQAPGRPADIRSRATWYDGSRRDYVAMVERLDAGVGRILQALERGGHTRNTLVVFTNDNGGERLSNNGTAFHRKMTLWEGGVRVPAILRWPGRIRPRTTTAQVAITMDFTATMLAAADVTPPIALEGIDLVPIVAGRAPLKERTFFWRYSHTPLLQKSVRRGQWKYLLDGIHELLFDLTADPSEHTNLAYQRPAELLALRELVAKWEADVDGVAPPFVIR